jgi:predicted phosphodiesterase
LEESLRARIEREKAAVVVFGHTHRPFSEVIDGVQFLNPGYAGRNRFGMERTLAILHCEAAGKLRVQYKALD